MRPRPTDTTVEDVAEPAPVVSDGHPAPATDESAGGSRPAARATLESRLFVVSVVAAIVPVLTAAVRAIADGWIPTEDNAFFPIRSRDVFSIDHLPLLGVWSSASQTSGFNFNHPGPLLFDLGAVPVRLFGGSPGTVVAIALINVLSVAGIAWFAYRRGGALLGTLATAVTATLCWTMGSEVLFEPWNPHSILLPFLLFLVLVWSVSCGDLLALPFVAGVGSLVAQAHLSYALLVPVLGVISLVLLLLRLRADGESDAVDVRARMWTALRYFAVAGAVLVACWMQPLIEQFTSDGDGNLTLLVRSATQSRAPTAGFGFGASAVAAVATLPPFWFRPSFGETFKQGWDPPAVSTAVASLVVLAVVLGVCAWVAWRRRDRTSWTALVIAAAGIVLGMVTAARSPETVFGRFQGHTLRWAWPLAAFIFLAVAVVVVRRLRRRAGSAAIVGVLSVITIIFAALTIPKANIGLGPTSFSYALPATRQLDAQMGRLEGRGPFLIDDLFHGAFADPYGAAVLAELQQRGEEFVATDAELVRLFGPARRFNGKNARSVLLLRISDETRTPPPGTRRVILAEGLSKPDRRELDRLQADITAFVAQGRLRLNARGRAALETGRLPNLARFQDQSHDAAGVLASREVDLMVYDHYLALDARWSARFARYAALHHEWDRRTVALFVGPIPPDQRGARS